MPEDFQDPFTKQIALSVYDREKDDRLIEWGAKLFYFDRRKCIQLCNSASKFTVVLVDVKKADLSYTADIVARYMLDIYSDNEKMTFLLKRLFKEHPFVCFYKITDRKTISSMNQFQSSYLCDGYSLYDFIENGILKTKDLNREINKDYIVTEKRNGRTECFYPAERFEELLTEYYK